MARRLGVTPTTLEANAAMTSTVRRWVRGIENVCKRCAIAIAIAIAIAAHKMGTPRGLQPFRRYPLTNESQTMTDTYQRIATTRAARRVEMRDDVAAQRRSANRLFKG